MNDPAGNELVGNDEPYIESEDYYMDGPYFVFTSAYHRKRGYCCGSGCRHCPYDNESSEGE